jgi:hypothetical protein
VNITPDSKEYWMQVALYLADCHAATLEDEGRRKSMPKHSKDRFRSICCKTLGMLMDGTLPNFPSQKTDVINRIKNALINQHL